MPLLRYGAIDRVYSICFLVLVVCHTHVFYENPPLTEENGLQARFHLSLCSFMVFTK